MNAAGWVRLLAVVSMPLWLAACGAAEKTWAPDAAVQAATYRFDGPPSLTLYTAINNNTGAGEHSGLMINADQRVLFDPAGSWTHSKVPERNDVHYGITAGVEHWYVNYHARPAYHVVRQEIVVSPAVAAEARRLVEAYGATPKAMCARAVSSVLSQLPGFEDIGRTYFPKTLMEEFGERPGVVTTYFYDDDEDNANPLRQQDHPDPIR